MRTLKQFQVKARKPNSSKFGDFIITDVNLKSQRAIAVFDDKAKVNIDISAIATQIAGYSRSRKKFYVSIV